MIINNPDASPEEMKAPPVPMKEGQSQQPISTPAEAPPPYTPPPGSSSSRGPPPLPAQPTGSESSVFRPLNAQTVNHFELFSKHDAISGTFLVDPLLPAPAVDMDRRLRRKRANVWGKSSKKTDINAAFRTRHGALNLDMEVVAQNPYPQPGEKVPARIIASTKHGRVNLDMHEVHPSRSLDLHVETSHGRIVVLLPPTFDGPIVFTTRHHNSVHFLPAFAARTRTLRASDRETVVHCSPASSPSSFQQLPVKPINQMADDPGDRCLVRTKHGKIVVGISGLDRVEEPQTGGGLFKALGRLFESQGKAFGQYVETHAKNIEKRSAALTEYVDKYLDGAGGTTGHGRGRGQKPGEEWGTWNGRGTWNGQALGRGRNGLAVPQADWGWRQRGCASNRGGCASHHGSCCP